MHRFGRLCVGSLAFFQWHWFFGRATNLKAWYATTSTRCALAAVMLVAGVGILGGMALLTAAGWPQHEHMTALPMMVRCAHHITHRAAEACAGAVQQDVREACTRIADSKECAGTANLQHPVAGTHASWQMHHPPYGQGCSAFSVLSQTKPTERCSCAAVQGGAARASRQQAADGADGGAA